MTTRKFVWNMKRNRLSYLVLLSTNSVLTTSKLHTNDHVQIPPRNARNHRCSIQACSLVSLSLFAYMNVCENVSLSSELQMLNPLQMPSQLLSNRFGIGLVRRADSEGTLGMQVQKRDTIQNASIRPAKSVVPSLAVPSSTNPRSSVLTLLVGQI